MKQVLAAYAGKILRINLSAGTVSSAPLPCDLACQYIGGRGAAAKLLYDELIPGIDPLSPENKLVFTSGPLAGSPAQSCSRWMVSAKSPLTGGIFRSSAGGGFGTELKAAGFDMLVVEGQSDHPVYIRITDNHAEIRAADHLWGLLTHETEDEIARELNDQKIKTAVIGPAGEKKVCFAAIVDHRKTAGRGGMGAVMGAKRLKAIAVRGSGKTTVADPGKLLAIVRKQVKAAKNSPKVKAFKHLGTASVVGFAHEAGLYPVKNFQEARMPEVMKTLVPEKIEPMFVRDAACCCCHLHCGSVLRLSQGPDAGRAVDGPEYETLYAFGGEVNNSSLEMIVEANCICDDYGLDTISAGCTIGFAMECYQKGLLSRKSLDNVDLTWGKPAAIITLLKKIANREGIGDLLAQGTRAAAESIGQGAENYAMQVKGLEMPGYEPRGLKGCALNFATAALGASHCVGQTYQEYTGEDRVDRLALEKKANLCKYHQDKVAILDCGVACIFSEALGIMTLADYRDMLTAAIGIPAFDDVSGLLLIGERIWNLERGFNVREGFSRKDDRLPQRFLHEPLAQGPARGAVVELDQLLADYYDLRGWDMRNGYPTRKVLERLDLKKVADDLEAMGRLGQTG